MSLLDLFGPYKLLVAAALFLAGAGCIFIAGDKHGARRVQSGWDQERAAQVIAQGKRTLRDLENSSQADTAITKRLATEDEVAAEVQRRISHVQKDAQCARIPRDLGVLVNAAALGAVGDSAAAGAPAGQPPVAHGLDPRPVE